MSTVRTTVFEYLYLYSSDRTIRIQYEYCSVIVCMYTVHVPWVQSQGLSNLITGEPNMLICTGVHAGTVLYDRGTVLQYIHSD